MVAAFVVVSALSAFATAALTFREARAAILERTQAGAVDALRSQIGSLAPALPYPPSARDLRDLALQLDRGGGNRNWRTSAAFRDGPLVPERIPDGGVPDALREAVGERHATVVQRIERDGEPWLIIAMPVDFSGSSGAREKRSGLSVYAELPLHSAQTDVDALVTAAQRGALPTVLLAVFPALLAARGVLRPVRRLRHAAQRITSGELNTRLEVTGSDELADLTGTFNEMAEALERSHSELRRLEANARRFAADVSHELRTPLAAMTAVTDILDEDAARLAPDTADAVRLISEETTKLARMAEDLMEISRFDAGAAVLHLSDVDVAETIRKTLQVRGWQAHVDLDLPDGIRSRLDPRRIDVVVANLVGNALRHGGAPVLVRLRALRDGVLIEVRDGGPGIDPDALPHVFDRFYKADEARTRSEGSGLGLAITQGNVMLHHGVLDAANAPEGGAVFTVVLPVDPPVDSPPDPRREDT